MTDTFYNNGMGTQDSTLVPSWMDPESSDYDPNWENQNIPIDPPLWIELGPGRHFPVRNRIQLHKYLFNDGARLIATPS